MVVNGLILNSMLNHSLILKSIFSVCVNTVVDGSIFAGLIYIFCSLFGHWVRPICVVVVLVVVVADCVAAFFILVFILN